MFKYRGLFYPSQLADPNSTTLWNQGQIEIYQRDLACNLAREWNDYIYDLRRAHIRISDSDDDLIWKVDAHGSYSLKKGYLQLIPTQLKRDPKWWWKRLWKLKCPSKSKLLMWCILDNKVPTWDILQKRIF